jgi:hypothetical protein
MTISKEVELGFNSPSTAPAQFSASRNHRRAPPSYSLLGRGCAPARRMAWREPPSRDGLVAVYAAAQGRGRD